ncbi:MAG: hypothetical protein RSA65_07330 [Clostridia bacterium]
MNCPKCGSLLPQGAMFCPVCNEPVMAGYSQPSAPMGYPPLGTPGQPGFDPQQMGGYAPTGQQPPAGYPGAYGGYQQPANPQQGFQPGAYQQSYSPYSQQSYPTGYQPPYVYGQQTERGENVLLNTLSELPRAFLDSFRHPGEVLRGMLERRDHLTCPVVTGVVLLLSFLGGMMIMRSVIGLLLVAISSLTGVSVASSTASMNQGISYIAGRIAPSVGGIAALCQLLAMLVNAAVMTVYLCTVCKTRFSWELLLGLCAITTLPTVAVVLAAMLLSLLTPWLSLLAIACGLAVSYAQMSTLFAAVTGRSEAQLLPARILCICISMTLTALLIGLVGGMLMSGVLQRMLVLLGNIGSLI